MPLAYNTPYMKKVIVLMTDGNNNWNDWNGGVPADAPGDSPGRPASPTGTRWTDDGDADFTAYGRLLDQHTRACRPRILRPRSTRGCRTMCTTIKQNGIIIYTIFFNNSNSATATMFQNCASPGPPTHYFNSPTGTDLQNAFTQIGHDLSSLRLAQ